MINKSVSPYLSFFFVLECIALIFVSSNIHAATMSISNKNHLSPYSSPLPSPDKKKTNLYLLQYTYTDDDNISDLTSSVQHPVNIKPIQHKSDTPTNNPNGKIKQSVKTFLDEHADNSLLQGSLLTFGKTKKLFNKTENMLNNLTQPMLLELDQYLQIELLLLQNNNAPRGFNYDNQQQKHHNSAAYRSNVSNTSNKSSDETDISFLRKILRITTLYYIFAFIIISASFKWLLTFILFGKYR